MTVQDVVDVLEAIAPTGAAEPWDNVGLLVGSRSWRAKSVLLTIDLTEAVLEEAVGQGAHMIVAYHPPIFGGLTALTDRSVKERLVLEAARASIAVYSPHTALDAAPGGVNDWLVDAFGPGETRALTAHATVPASEERKLVTFCPPSAAEAIRRALAEAGAGRIGEYRLCSFEIEGTGTFLAGKATAPAVGRRGRLERVPEIRLEMVCSAGDLGAAVAALRAAHPYEEPPIEIYALEPRPHRGVGAGRERVLTEPLTLRAIVGRLKRSLGVKTLHVAAARGTAQRYRTVAVCAGAGGLLLETALARGCELFLTGEMRHHDVLAALAAQCTIVLAGHTNTERGYLKRLRRRLSQELPKCTIAVSRHDRDPLRPM